MRGMSVNPPHKGVLTAPSQVKPNTLTSRYGETRQIFPSKKLPAVNKAQGVMEFRLHALTNRMWRHLRQLAITPLTHSLVHEPPVDGSNTGEARENRQHKATGCSSSGYSTLSSFHDAILTAGVTWLRMPSNRRREVSDRFERVANITTYTEEEFKTNDNPREGQLD